MSGHQVRRVTQFELEIVGLRIVIDTVPTSVKQMDMFIIYVSQSKFIILFFFVCVNRLAHHSRWCHEGH